LSSPQSFHFSEGPVQLYNSGRMQIKVIVVAAMLLTDPAVAQEPGGVFSRLAIPVWAARSSNFIAKSPDGTKALIVKANTIPYSNEIHRVRVQANGKEYKTRIGYLVNSEVAWSPDS